MITNLESKSKSHPKYGITERKKAELDALTIKVLDAQYEVSQCQAIVTALTAKSEEFQGFFADAEAKRAQALNDKNLVDQVVENAKELLQNSKIANDKMSTADTSINDVATQINTVMDQLIYSGEVLNKLANVVAQKKQQNPLISDELISRISDAGKDTNTAVALTLVALKSTFAAQASSGEASAATAVQTPKANELYKKLTDEGSIKELLTNAYNTANTNYVNARKANMEATRQLNIATINLNKAIVKLNSLQAGLSAANAAALAS